MSDYIEREAALETVKAVANICDSLPDGPVKEAGILTLKTLKRNLLELPAADVRPVVLCRDCTFFKPQQKSKRWSSTTPMCSRSATIKMPPDGFCSFGVKREES